jgi:hypothetical protein
MWPRAELDHLQLSLRMQVWRVVFLFGIRAMLDGEFDRDAARERDRERRPEDSLAGSVCERASVERLEDLARKRGASGSVTGATSRGKSGRAGWGCENWGNEYSTRRL